LWCFNKYDVVCQEDPNCYVDDPNIDVERLADLTKQLAEDGDIDPVENVLNDK